MNRFPNSSVEIDENDLFYFLHWELRWRNILAPVLRTRVVTTAGLMLGKVLSSYSPTSRCIW